LADIRFARALRASMAASTAKTLQAPEKSPESSGRTANIRISQSPKKVRPVRKRMSNRPCIAQPTTDCHAAAGLNVSRNAAAI
jgi:hypothetical protein